MSNSTPPLIPLPEDHEQRDGIPRREQDGEDVIDRDANPENIDSATADRVAAEEPGEDAAS
nr:hypothetical protein [uncultured Microbacterium sp.]